MQISEILVLAAAYALGYIAAKYRTYSLQSRSEAVVSRVLATVFRAPDYHLLSNLTVPTAQGTTQIDHVLVSRFGVFVIETKEYKGWIFASADSPRWTQVLFKHRFTFQNPLRQNYGHVRSVQALLEFLPPEFVRSLVVFTGEARFKIGKPPNVVTLDELIPYLKGFSERVLSENRVQFCVGRLECSRLALTHQTDIEHRQRLAKRFGEKS